MKMLITQGTTAFAQRVAKNFTANHPDARYSFASSAEIPNVLVASGRYKAIPTSDHPAFIHELLKLALDEGADYLLPLGRDEAVGLSGSKLLFREYGIDVLVPDLERIEGLPILENPPRSLELHLLYGSRRPNDSGETADLAGVFSYSDDGHPYWCLSSAEHLLRQTDSTVDLKPLT